MMIRIGNYRFDGIVSLNQQFKGLEPSKVTFSLVHGRRFILQDARGKTHSFKLNELINAVEKAVKKNNEISESANEELVEFLFSVKRVWNNAGYLRPTQGVISKSQETAKYENLIEKENFLIRWITKLKHDFTQASRNKKIASLKSKSSVPLSQLSRALKTLIKMIQTFESKDKLVSGKITFLLHDGIKEHEMKFAFQAPIEKIRDKDLNFIKEKIKGWMSDKEAQKIAINGWEATSKTKSGKEYFCTSSMTEPQEIKAPNKKRN